MRIIFLKRNNFLGKQNVRYDAKTRMKLYVILLYSELVLTSLKRTLHIKSERGAQALACVLESQA